MARHDAAVTRQAEHVEQGFWIERVVDHLAETAETGDEGVTWYTDPELLVTWQREQAPTGYYNLGVAHDIPGAIAMLGAVLGAVAVAARARRDGRAGP